MNTNSQKMEIDNYKKVINSSEQIIAAMDTEFNYLVMNSAYKNEFKRIFGVEIEEGQNMKEALLHLPEERENAVKVWSKAMQGQTYSVVHEFGDARLGRKIYQINTSPLVDERGIIFGATQSAVDITDKATAEDLLSRVLNASQNGIQVYKSIRNEKNEIIDFQWLLVNDAMLSMWGKKREEIIGNRMLKVFPGVKESDLFDFYTIGTTSEIYINKEIYYNHDGLDHWFDLSAIKFEDGFILSAQDVTQQKKAEMVLKQTNVELEQKVIERTAQIEKERQNMYNLFRQAPSAVAALYGPTHIYELANELYQKIFNRTEEQLIGRTVKEVFPEIDGQGIVELFDNVYSNGQPYIANKFLAKFDRTGSGKLEEGYFTFIAQPITDETGKVERILVHAMETTDEVRAIQLVEESEDRFRTLADNMPNLAWMANPDGGIFWYNKRWYEYTGTTAEEMEGWGWQSVHDADQLPTVIERWKESIASGIPFEMVFPLKGHDGEFRPYLTRVVPIRIESGEIVRWFGTNTDISELENKNKQLLKINADLDNFIYTASHDLKAPISNIEGLIAGLPESVTRETNESKEFQYIMQMVNKSIDRFKTTIQDLTDISRVQRNIAEDEDEIDICEILENIKVSLKNEIEEASAVITQELDSCPKVNYSKRNFRSILYNLISNSLKYKAFDRTAIINIKAKTEGEFIILTFKDNGLGIESSKINHIFGMFKRFHNHVEGSGVGLYIVKRIVENNGGKIEVDSKVGEGTTFTVYLKK
ncbi:MAG TPA: PAS domain-containing protein [Cytophagaceae bacterium]